MKSTGQEQWISPQSGKIKRGLGLCHSTSHPPSDVFLRCLALVNSTQVQGLNEAVLTDPHLIPSADTHPQDCYFMQPAPHPSPSLCCRTIVHSEKGEIVSILMCIGL